MLVIIDNYDSFTFNIVQTLASCPVEDATGWQPPEMKVFRNDKITVEDIAELKPDRLLISPGPCTPKEAGISVEAIKYFSTRIPVLGVCLGHQSIGEAFGGKVIRAGRVMHGKTSHIHHDGLSVFAGLDQDFVATRYHSLVIEPDTLPDDLVVTATAEDGSIMGLRHRTFPSEGIQFHPESILTSCGPAIIDNWLRAVSKEAV